MLVYKHIRNVGMDMGLRTLAALEKLEAKQPGHPCVEELFRFSTIVGKMKRASVPCWLVTMVSNGNVILMLLFTMKINNALRLVSLDHGISV